MKKLVIFDLDGTLAQSKSALDAEMAQLLGCLLGVVPVAVISGGDWPQFQAQLLSGISLKGDLKRLFLLPTCGTKYYHYGSGWKQLYAQSFRAEEKKKIIDSLQKASMLFGLRTEKRWGETIEDRDSQITFSALGQDAPLEEKKSWDPDFAKRKEMKSFLDTILPEFSVRLGGTTSIDVTPLGVDKAFGIKKLRDSLRVSLAEMVFVGDALFPGGNDYPVKELGVECIQVRDHNETKRVIEAFIACLRTEVPSPPEPALSGRNSWVEGLW
ncbi:MAG: HAD-IIB family hydrolase [Vulcanimicrobiota bacterium]